MLFNSCRKNLYLLISNYNVKIFFLCFTTICFAFAATPRLVYHQNKSRIIMFFFRHRKNYGSIHCEFNSRSMPSICDLSSMASSPKSGCCITLLYLLFRLRSFVRRNNCLSLSVIRITSLDFPSTSLDCKHSHIHLHTTYYKCLHLRQPQRGPC